MKKASTTHQPQNITEQKKYEKHKQIRIKTGTDQQKDPLCRTAKHWIWKWTVRWLPWSHFQRESTIGSCPEDSNRHHFSLMAQDSLRSLPHSHLSACFARAAVNYLLCVARQRPTTTSFTVPPHAQGLKTRTRTSKPSGKWIHRCLRSPPRPSGKTAKASQQSSLWLWCC